jgi:hypothetical protein
LRRQRDYLLKAISGCSGAQRALIGGKGGELATAEEGLVIKGDIQGVCPF